MQVGEFCTRWEILSSLPKFPIVARRFNILAAWRDDFTEFDFQLWNWKTERRFVVVREEVQDLGIWKPEQGRSGVAY